MTAETTTSPKSRWLSALCYLRINPYRWPFRGDPNDPLLSHHVRQMRVLKICSTMVVLILILELWAFLAFAYHFGEVLTSSSIRYTIAGLAFLPLPMVRVMLSALGIRSAVRGTTTPIPLVGRWADHSAVPRLYKFAVIIPWVILTLVAGITVRATREAQTSPAGGTCYLLYDSGLALPRWVYCLGFYPVVREASDRWGAGSAVVAPFTPESFSHALHEGKFVFLATHGSGGVINVEGYAAFKPEDVHTTGVGQNLQFVYITACDAGVEDTAWKNAFAPAELVLHPRWTSVAEHTYWLLTEAREQVRRLK